MTKKCPKIVHFVDLTKTYYNQDSTLQENITLVSFDVQERTIPHFKAKDISFGPYFLPFLATVNILLERKH